MLAVEQAGLFQMQVRCKISENKLNFNVSFKVTYLVVAPNDGSDEPVVLGVPKLKPDIFKNEITQNLNFIFLRRNYQHNFVEFCRII